MRFSTSSAFSYASAIVAHVDYAIVEELCLVDAHDIHAFREKEYRRRRVDRRGGDGGVVMADDILVAIACVDGRLEYLNLLAGYLRTLHAADKLLCLAREHRATYHLYAALAAVLALGRTMTGALLLAANLKNKEALSCTIQPCGVIVRKITSPAGLLCGLAAAVPLFFGIFSAVRH